MHKTFALMFTVLLGGCGERRLGLDAGADQTKPARDGSTPELQPDSGDLPREAGGLLPKSVSAPVDVLFVVDNSNSMEEEQARLVAQFSAMIDALTVGGRLPDLLGVGLIGLGVATRHMETPTERMLRLYREDPDLSYRFAPMVLPGGGGLGVQGRF